MTAQQLSDKYGYSITSIEKKWSNTQRLILKKYGVEIKKIGRGKKASYIEELVSDMRAMTIFDENKNEIILNSDSMSLDNFQFLSFLAIITTPMLVFRGSYEEFLKYMGVRNSKENISKLKFSLVELKNKDFIIFTPDKTDKNYFIAGLYKEVEREMSVGIMAVRKCKQLAEEYNKRDWIPLFKVWAVMQLYGDGELFNNAMLEEATGLTESMISDCRKILNNSDILKISAVRVDKKKCIGSIVELNGFYN